MSGFGFTAKIFSAVETIKADKNLYNGIIFVFSCLLLLIVSFTILHYLPHAIKEVLVSGTASASVLLAKMFGLNARIVPENEIWLIGHFVSINGYVFNVIFGCVALNYILIFISGVVTYPAPLRERIYGVLIVVPIIVVLNIFRIVFLGWFGANYPQHVEFLHKVFWEWTFFFAVVVLWWLWITYGEAILSKKWLGIKELAKLFYNTIIHQWTREISLIVLIVLIFTAHSFLTEWYMAFLALLSGLSMKLFGLGNIINALPHGVSVLGWVTTVPSVMEICLFLGFTVCFSISDDKRLFFKHLFMGILIIVFIHIAIIYVTYFDIRDGVPNLVITNRINAVVPFTPFFIWLFLNASDTIKYTFSHRLGLGSKIKKND